MRCERRAHCLMLHLKCAVSPVGIYLTNALRSHHLCALECSGLIYLKTEGCFQFQMLTRALFVKTAHACGCVCKWFNVLVSQNDAKFM